MAIAITCFRNMWLQMRINTGYVFIAVWVILTILIYIIMKKGRIGAAFTGINLSVCFLYSYILFGWKRLQVVPASLLREGIRQPLLKFTTVNRVMLAFVAAGFVIICIAELRLGKRIKGNIK